MQVQSINSTHYNQNFGKIVYSASVKEHINNSLSEEDKEALVKLENSQENNPVNIIIESSNYTGNDVGAISGSIIPYVKRSESFLTFIKKMCDIANEYAYKKNTIEH